MLFSFVQSARVLFSVADSATLFVSDNMAQFQIYNSMLRRFPRDVYEVFKEAGNRFSSTLFALVSALVKLSRVETVKPGTKLYRGMGGSFQLPDSFYSPDEFGTRGYVENAFLSCQTDFQVALQWSGAKSDPRKPFPSVMVFECGAIDRPCSISEFSQCDISSVPQHLLVPVVLMICRYPAERQVLWPPFSVVQPSGDSWVELHYGVPVTM
jgi:hypothetical protein